MLELALILIFTLFLLLLSYNVWSQYQQQKQKKQQHAQYAHLRRQQELEALQLQMSQHFPSSVILEHCLTHLSDESGEHTTTELTENLMDNDANHALFQLDQKPDALQIKQLKQTQILLQEAKQKGICTAEQHKIAQQRVGRWQIWLQAQIHWHNHHIAQQNHDWADAEQALKKANELLASQQDEHSQWLFQQFQQAKRQFEHVPLDATATKETAHEQELNALFQPKKKW